MHHAIVVLFFLCFHISLSAEICKPDLQPSSKCSEWKEGGYCTGSWESTYYMKTNCYSTCRGCQGPNYWVSWTPNQVQLQLMEVSTVFREYGFYRIVVTPKADVLKDRDILQSFNHGQKSWDKFALLALLHTGQTRIQLHPPSPTPHSTYNVGN